MRIGVVKECKSQEYRVALLPEQVGLLVKQGHEVFVQQDAGLAIGYADSDYQHHGAQLCADMAGVYAQGDLIVKVKEPQEEEFEMLRAGQILFTYLHLAAYPKVCEVLIKKQVTSIAYECIQLTDGTLPCLLPMSMVAGRLAAQEGARFMQKSFGGRGQLMSALPGVAAAKVLVFGAGIVGQNAAQVALGLGADVKIYDISEEALKRAENNLAFTHCQYAISSEALLAQDLPEADLLIGAVLVAGARAPKVLVQRHLELLRPATVLVDVAIDQGGCFTGSRATSHEEPIFIENGLIRYCVANMPSAAALSATKALTHVTFPYLQDLANKGLNQALREYASLAAGLNTHQGELKLKALVED